MNQARGWPPARGLMHAVTPDRVQGVACALPTTATLVRHRRRQRLAIEHIAPGPGPYGATRCLAAR